MAVQDEILHAIDAAAERVIEVSRKIHAHPELRFQGRGLISRCRGPGRGRR
jgi:hypothetical protein